MVIFAGMALKLEKVGPTFSSFNPCPPGADYFGSCVHSVHPTLGTRGFFLASGWVPRSLGVVRRPKPETALEKSVVLRVRPSLLSVAKDERKQFQFLKLVLNNKTRPLF